MALPFSLEDFLAVFSRYNETIWPLQVFAHALGIAAVALSFRSRSYSGPAISGILATFWLITGGLYHPSFFRAINPAAIAFGLLFIVEGLAFIWMGVIGGRLTFSPGVSARSLTAGLLVLYAMVLYPLLGISLGHVYPAAPVFGVAPCPVVIFSFGMLLWSGARTPKWLLAIPIAWAVIGISAALSLGMYEDLGLVIAGVASALFTLTPSGGRSQIGQPSREHVPSTSGQ